ncbi:MAG: hypothetical protein ABJE10_17285 [bacterium]
MHDIRLVHDILDAQLCDRNNQNVGRVDALVLEIDDGRAPRVATILVGGSIRARRIGRWVTTLLDLMRQVRHTSDDKVSRIPFSLVRRIDDAIHVDVDEKDLPSEHRERWLKQHVVCRIPGAEGERK